MLISNPSSEFDEDARSKLPRRCPTFRFGGARDLERQQTTQRIIARSNNNPAARYTTQIRFVIVGTYHVSQLKVSTKKSQAATVVPLTGAMLVDKRRELVVFIVVADVPDVTVVVVDDAVVVVAVAVVVVVVVVVVASVIAIVEV